MNSLGYSHRDVGSSKGPPQAACSFYAPLLPCLALIACAMATLAQAQTLTPDMLRPVRGGFVSPQDLPLRKTRGRRQPDRSHRRSHARRQRAATRTRRRRRGSGRSRQYGLPAASGASDAGFDSLNRTRKKPKLYPGQAKPKPPPGPGSPAPDTGAGRPRRVSAAVDAASESANKPPIPPAMAGTVAGQPPRKRLQGRRRSVRRGRRLCRQLPDQVRGRTQRRLRHQSRPHQRCRRACRSGWWRRNSSRCPTGIATRWSPISAAPSPATATACRRPSMARSPRRRPMSTGRISSAMSTAASMSPATPRSPRKCACWFPPTIPAARTSRPGLPNIRSTRRSAARFGLDQNFNRLEIRRRRHRRPHRLPELHAHRRRDLQQRRPQLQPVRRRRPRQLRTDAGDETVRRGRGRQPRARSRARPQRLCAQFQRRLRQGRHLVRILAAVDRRNLGRLCRAQLCRSAARPACRAC